MEACGIDPSINHKTRVVCGDHFADSDFYNFYKTKLRDNTVPTLNLPAPQETPLKTELTNPPQEILEEQNLESYPVQKLEPFKVCTPVFIHNGILCRSIALQTTTRLENFDPIRIQLIREVHKLRKKVRGLKEYWRVPKNTPEDFKPDYRMLKKIERIKKKQLLPNVYLATVTIQQPPSEYIGLTRRTNIDD